MITCLLNQASTRCWSTQLGEIQALFWRSSESHLCLSSLGPEIPQQHLLKPLKSQLKRPTASLKPISPDATAHPGLPSAHQSLNSNSYFILLFSTVIYSPVGNLPARL